MQKRMTLSFARSVLVWVRLRTARAHEGREVEVSRELVHSRLRDACAQTSTSVLSLKDDVVMFCFSLQD